MTSYVAKPTAHKKYVRELLARLPKGFEIGMVEEESDGTRPARLVNRTHPCVLTPDGRLLRSDDGRPGTVCGSAGDRRSLINDLRKIERAIEMSRDGVGASRG